MKRPFYRVYANDETLLAEGDDIEKTLEEARGKTENDVLIVKEVEEKIIEIHFPTNTEGNQ